MDLLKTAMYCFMCMNHFGGANKLKDKRLEANL